MLSQGFPPVPLWAGGKANHPLFPGMFEEEDTMVWGTLEIKASGPLGSEIGKMAQAYSPISHIIKANADYALAPHKHESLEGKERRLGILGGHNPVQP